ncbi:damage-inducible protein DinB [Algoriphagus aestuariicola]|uniref:Damage-inducible protein DinB n=1 Tax=Algoriphagus aestuariicola TaxID=1852016 RepID=A0ABS3BKW6_9BACT|nr:DinB family protein [Algoriphagus aestuariicola]MBN7799948.1 damage-inducible protein DinB [Algoriphagus aestuariicola]
MKLLIKDLFAYNHQVNQTLEERFRSYDYKLDLETMRLASHMLNAHQIWVDRVEGRSSLKSPWEDFPLDAFGSRNHELHVLTENLLESKDLQGTVRFKTFAGVEFEKKIADILVHVVNHSTYHRGQIAFLMRKGGLEPVSTDYINWAK